MASIKSDININLKNLPIGSTISRWHRNALSIPTIMNDFVANCYDYVAISTGSPLYRSDVYNRIIGNSSALSVNRTAMTRNSSDWSVFTNTNNIFQKSSDGSSFTLQDYGVLNLIDTNYGSANYCSNYANNKTVFTNTLYSYVYSEDGTNFTFIKSPIVSSVHINIVRPYQSGLTYSFWDSTNSKRIYTTNHTTFSDVTGFGTTDLPIHTMNNGHLYTTTGTTLRISTDDGVSWTSYTLPASTNNSGNHCLDFDGTTYVYGTTSNALYSSTDLNSWTLRTSNITGTPILSRVYFRNTLWFVFSATSATTSISTSANGTAWTNRTWGTGAMIGNSVVYANSLYIVMCAGAIQTSSDGVTWTQSISISSGNQQDSDQRSFYGTGTVALCLSNNIAYFYNAGAWTTVTTAQQTTDILQMPTGSMTGFLIKGK